MHTKGIPFFISVPLQTLPMEHQNFQNFSCTGCQAATTSWLQCVQSLPAVSTLDIPLTPDGRRDVLLHTKKIKFYTINLGPHTFQVINMCVIYRIKA